jgi:ribA/ribD-fused uncharacterized protein
MAMFESKYIFFYGHHPRYGGKHYLSNWCPSPFVSEEELEKEGSPHVYENNEQYMMAEKARLFGDDNALANILSNGDPAFCKKWGRRVKGFDAVIWNNNCKKIVSNGIYYKFTQNREMGDYLVSTGDKILVETNPHDNIWGIGITAHEAARSLPSQWPGTNYLGECLMEVREMLTVRDE